MNKKWFLTSIFSTLIICFVIGQKRLSVSAKDFTTLNGCWQGTLNYSGTMIRKPFTTTAELKVEQIGKSGKFRFLHIYTKDSSENIADTLAISLDGKMINRATIRSKRFTDDGKMEVITEETGFDHDNNKAAIIRHTYTLGKQSYSYKKQVRLKGESDWLDRQEFNYKRKFCESKH